MRSGSLSRTSQNLVLLLIILTAALTGGALVRAVDRAKGIHVDLGPDGTEIHVWNSTTSTWGRCAITLDNQFGVEANRIPGRTLLMLPKRLFGAPPDWEPRYAVVRCQEPRLAQWENPVPSTRF
jgi:hypothetical protein